MEKLILKCIWNLKGPLVAKTILKKNTLGDSHFLISKLTTKIIKQCGTGKKTDIQTNGTEERAQK